MLLKPLENQAFFLVTYSHLLLGTHGHNFLGTYGVEDVSETNGKPSIQPSPDGLIRITAAPLLRFLWRLDANETHGKPSILASPDGHGRITVCHRRPPSAPLL